MSCPDFSVDSVMGEGVASGGVAGGVSDGLVGGEGVGGNEQ